jgi:hypothetical protein
VNRTDPQGLLTSGPGGQLCEGHGPNEESTCNSSAVPINSCGTECASGGQSAAGPPPGPDCGVCPPGPPIAAYPFGVDYPTAAIFHNPQINPIPGGIPVGKGPCDVTTWSCFYATSAVTEITPPTLGKGPSLVPELNFISDVLGYASSCAYGAGIGFSAGVIAGPLAIPGAAIGCGLGLAANSTGDLPPDLPR